MNKRTQINRLETKITLQEHKRDSLMSNRLTQGISHDEFLDISDQITELSNTIGTSKRKLYNLRVGLTELGDKKPRIKE